MTENAPELLRRHIDAGLITGGVILLANGDRTEVTAEGLMAVDGPPMREDAVFRIQSMTKPVTTVAALRLVEQGRLRLDDAVDQWLPELADRVVLRTPESELDDVVPADRPITVRDLLTNGSGYGMHFADTPWNRAMADAGVAAGPEPVALGADEWLAAHAPLPLAHQPGAGFRYHNSFSILGILLSRLTGVPLDEHLRTDLFEPLGMGDTGFWLPEAHADRLPAAYRVDGGTLVETEPMAGGFYVGEPPYDVSHSELVSTAADFATFARVLVDGTAGGQRILSAESVAAMKADQVAPEAKAPDAFFPGFWDGSTWGYGGSIVTTGEHTGRFGWSGGLGTDFYVEPDGRIAVLLIQVELGPETFAVVDEFQALRR